MAVKRKLNIKAKRAMSLFSGLVVTTMGGFGYGAYRMVEAQPAGYPVSADAVIYDSEANRVPMTTGGEVSRGWNGEWKLKLDDGSTFALGANNVVFDGGKLCILGGGYRIMGDNSVERLPNYSEVDPAADGSFYKLADRRYLLVSDEISDTGSVMDTSDYLYVVMDRAGNAVLLNQEMCAKTLNATVLDAGDYTFDIANEVLSMGLNEVDCKNVIGSTNQYDPNNDMTILREKYKDRQDKGYTNNPEEIVLDLTGGDGGDGGIGGTGGTGGTGGLGGTGGTGGYGGIGGDGGYGGDGGLGGTGGFGGNGGQGGTGGNGGTGGTGGTGGDGGKGGTAVLPDVVNARKTMSIYSIRPSRTSITIYYNVNDPYGQLGDVYFKLTEVGVTDAQGNPISATYPADIDATQKTIYNLKPNTRYRVDFCEGLGGTVKDTQYVSTVTVNVSILVTGMTENTLDFLVTAGEGTEFGTSQAAVAIQYYSWSSTDRDYTVPAGDTDDLGAGDLYSVAGEGYYGSFSGLGLPEADKDLYLGFQLRDSSGSYYTVSQIKVTNAYYGTGSLPTSASGGQSNWMLPPRPAADPTPTPEVTATPTPLPTEEPTPTAEPTPTPEAEPIPTPLPTAEPTPTPEAEPTPTPLPTEEPTPTPEAEPTPTPLPTAEPTPTPEAEPTPTPAPEPPPAPEPTPTPEPAPAPESGE